MNDANTYMQAAAIVLVIICIIIAYYAGERFNPKDKNKERDWVPKRVGK